MGVILDGMSIHNREELHELLAQALGFPAWYGGNMDALFDCLRDLDETALTVTHCAAAARQLGDAWPGFVAVFLDAAAENPRLTIRLRQGK